MTLYFDATKLGEPTCEYVAWLDVMGIQGALIRSIPVAANFVYKLHTAALQARSDGITLYPVMDGVYICAPSGERLEQFIREVFRGLVELFTNEPNEHFLFVVKGAVARGNVYHGARLNPDASWTLRDNPTYRDSILLGEPMVRAHLGEREAPPFGVFVDSSAEHFTSGEPYPFDLWWRWYSTSDSDLVEQLRCRLQEYYDWATASSADIGYGVDRIRVHRGQSQLYLGGA